MALLSIGFGLFLIVSFIGSAHRSGFEKGRAATAEKVSHWSRWSEPRVTSDWRNGTRCWQMKTNLDTGEVIMKMQQVSADAGYLEEAK